jgi:hypothetical protein
MSCVISPRFSHSPPGVGCGMATLCVELGRSKRAPRVAQTSVCALFSAPTQIKISQAEACATGLPHNSREKCALDGVATGALTLTFFKGGVLV